MRGAPVAEMRLDLFRHHPAENVAPRYRRRQPARPRESPRQPSASRSPSPAFSVASRSIPAWRSNASATVSRSGSANGSTLRGHETETACAPTARAACGQQRSAVLHQSLVVFVGAIPFQQRELRMMQRGALAIAEHAGEIEDARLAGRQQFLAGEFRRGAQIERVAFTSGADQLGRKSMQMRFIARRNLQCCGLDLNEIPRGEPRPQSRRDLRARQQKRPPVGVHGRVPMRRRSVSTR